MKRFRGLRCALVVAGALGLFGPTPLRAAADRPALPDFGAAPELCGIDGWVNSKPITLGALRGRVVLVKFWTFSCINCIHTLAATQKWYDTYHPRGLEIIGVHTPETAHERVPGNVERAVRDNDITYPVALDPDFRTWNAYHNRYWPAVYLVDAQGRIRYTHVGEGDYDGTARAIESLLKEEVDRSGRTHAPGPVDETSPAG